MFQSTHPHGVRQYHKLNVQLLVCFNPRTHMGCDLILFLMVLALRCFNPRTHMGCDHKAEKALAEANEFQSTHPHGVRQLHFSGLFCTYCFNPRTHMGCDLSKSVSKSYDIEFQSTHPHGVRHGTTHKDANKRMFQSTHPHGVRLHKEASNDEVPQFQSTHPHGVRLIEITLLCSCALCFNPRTHMGCDSLKRQSYVAYTVSIHAPTWGATQLKVEVVL